MVSLKGGGGLDKALAGMADKLAKATVVDVGFLENATYPDGKKVALIAAINEYGAPSRGQPPRPFFRRMINAKSGEWPSAVAALLKANGYDAAKTLDQTGFAVAGQLRQSIADFTSPALKQSTIDRKGSAKPLVDSGVMIQSVDHIVK